MRCRKNKILWNSQGFVSQKKGVSDVISTVLIILITIFAVGILATVVINFTKNNLKEGELCVNVQNKLSFNYEKSCYDLDKLKSTITIKRGNVETNEIYLSLERNGNFEVYKLKEGETVSIITDPNPISLPQVGGGEKTYEISFVAKEARIGLVLDGKQCPISDEIILKKC